MLFLGSDLRTYLFVFSMVSPTVRKSMSKRPILLVFALATLRKMWDIFTFILTKHFF